MAALHRQRAEGSLRRRHLAPRARCMRRSQRHVPVGSNATLKRFGPHLCLEELQRAGDVQHGLCPRADHRHWRAPQLGQVR
jgi:hypothetical protein